MKFTNTSGPDKVCMLGDLKQGDHFEWQFRGAWTGAVAVVRRNDNTINDVMIMRLDDHADIYWEPTMKVRRVEIEEVKYKVIN